MSKTTIESNIRRAVETKSAIFDLYPNGNGREEMESLIKLLTELLTTQKQELVEKLDELAYEYDDGYKVRLLIDWDEAKKLLTPLQD